MNRSAAFWDMYETTSIPPFTKQTLDFLEFFLISGFDSQIKERIPTIINFFCENLPNSPNYEQENTDEINEMQNRILKLLHLVKPNYLTVELSTQIEEKLFELINYEGILRLHALSVLFDHFVADCHGVPERDLELIRWSHGILKEVPQQMPEIDYKFIISIITNIELLFKSNKGTLSETVVIFEAILDITNSCVNFCDDDCFFPQIEHLFTKCIKMACRIFEFLPKMTSHSISVVVDLNTKIPRTVEFSRIFLDYLFLCSVIFSASDKKIPGKIVEIVRTEIIMNLPYFSQKPLVKSRKVISLMKNLRDGLQETISGNDKELTEILLSSVYSFIASTDIHHNGIVFAIELLKKVITPFQSNIVLLNDVITQLMAIIDMHSDDFFDAPQQWIDINLRSLKFIKMLLVQFLKTKKDEKSSRMDIMSRLTIYQTKIIDIIAKIMTMPEYQNYRVTLHEILNTYIELASNIPSEWSYEFFKEHMQYFLPASEKHRDSHNFVMKLILRLQGPGQFIIALFEYISENPEKATKYVVELLYKIVIDTFTTSSIIQLRPDEVVPAAHALYKLFLASINSNNAFAIEYIFCTILWHLQRMPPDKENKLSAFVDDLKKTGINWRYALWCLKPELVYSKLAVHLFAVLNIKEDQHQWYELFIPMLESEDTKIIDIYAFYFAVQANFGKNFKEIIKPTQNRLFNALTRQLASDPGKVSYIRLLLQQISDTTSSLCSETVIKKPIKRTVIVDGQKVVLETIHKAYTISENENYDFLFKVFNAAIEQISYNEIVKNEIINKISVLLKEKTDLLEGYFVSKLEEMPEKAYSCYFFQFVLFNEVIVPDEEVLDFLNDSSFMFSGSERISEILHITDKLIEKIPFGKKWLPFILNILTSSQEEYEFGIKIIKDHVLSREFNTQEEKEFLNAFYPACLNASRMPMYTVKKVVSTIFYELDKMPIINQQYAHKRNEALEKYLSLLKYPQIYNSYHFIFSRSFEDYGNLKDLFDKVTKVLKFDLPDSMYKTDKYRDEISHLISRGLPLDNFSVNLKKTQYLLKTLARGFIAYPQENFLYVQIFKQLSEKNARQFLSYFINCIIKGVNKGMGSYESLPSEPQELFQFTTPVQLPKKHQLKILVFLSQTGKYASKMHLFLRYISACCSILANQDPKKRRKVYSITNFLIKTLNNCALFKNDPSIQTGPPGSSTTVFTQQFLTCIRSLINLTQALRASPYPVHIPLEDAIPNLESEFLGVFKSLLAKENDMNLIYTLEKLFTSPKPISFTSFCVEALHSNFTPILEFYQHASLQSRGLMEVLTRKLFHAFAKATNNNNLHGNILRGMILITIKLFKTTYKDFKLFKPTLFFDLLNILIPQQLDETDEALCTVIVKESIPFILGRPDIFMNNVGIKRVASVLKKVVSLRDKTVSYFINSMPESIRIKTFFKLVLTDFFTEFPPEESVSLPIGDGDTPNIIAMYTYYYTSCMMLKFDKVEVPDAGNTHLYYSNSDINEQFILRNIVGPESIATLSRLRKLAFNGKVKSVYEEIEDRFEEEMIVMSYYVNSASIYKVFKPSSNPFSIKSHHDFQLLIIGLGIKSLSQNPIIATILRVYIDLFKVIVESFDKSFYPAIFNLFLDITLFSINNQNKISPFLTNMHGFNTLSEFVSFEDVNKEALNKIKKYLMVFKPEDIPKNLPSYRVYFILIPALAKYLFHKESPRDLDYFSDAFLPKQLLQNKHLCNLFNFFFKNMITEVYKYGSKETMKRIIDDLEAYIRSQPNVEISKQLKRPFPTVLRWSTEISRRMHFFKQISIFVEGLMPYNAITLVEDLKEIKFPLNNFYYKQIMECIKKLGLEDKIGLQQEFAVYGKKPEGDLISACWNNNWLVQPPSHHLYVFAKILYPESIASFVNYINEDDLQELVTITITYYDKRLERFIRYYYSVFPDTTLSAAFQATEIFAMEMPLPQKSLFKNVKYLAEITNHDDMLGLVKTMIPELEVAASYHQLNQYEAAKQEYFKALDKNTDNLGLVLHLLRPIVLNLDFPTMTLNNHLFSNIPELKTITLNVPIVKIFASRNKLIERNAVSREIYIPKSHFILPTMTAIQRLVVFDEARNMLHTIQKVPLDGRGVTLDPHSISLLKTHMVDTLDKNCFLVSTLGFRAQQIQMFRSYKDQYAAVTSFSLNFIALLLAKTNAIRQAIKVFQRSIQTIDVSLLHPPIPRIPNTLQRGPDPQHPFIPNNNPVNGSMPPLDSRMPLSVTHTTVPRFYRMLSKINPQSATLIPSIKTRLDYMLEVFDFNSFHKIVAASKPPNMYYTKYFTFMFYYFPKQFCSISFLDYLFKQLSIFIKANHEQFNIMFSLALSIVRREPDLTNSFFERILCKLNVDQTTVQNLIRWLPHLLTIFDSLPIDFMKKLIRLRATHVCAIMLNTNAQFSTRSSKFIHDELMKVCMSIPEVAKKFKEYDSMFSWAREAEEDIKEYKNKVFVHVKLSEVLASGREIPREIKDIAGETIDDMIKYTEDNPPYFKTSKKTIELKDASGFKLPNLYQPCFNIQIFADGTKDAKMRFMSRKGVFTDYTIVCPELFPLNCSSEIFLNCLSELFNMNLAEKLRSTFIDRTVTLYYIHNSLVLMFCDAKSLQQISGVPIVSKLLRRRKELDEQGVELQRAESVTPYEIKRRKDIDYETHSLLKWILKGAGGNKIDFMFMRQSLASHLAGIAAIKFLFNSSYAIYPNIMFNNDRRKIYIPGMIQSSRRVVHMPLTPLISSFMPMYVLKGTFATTWHIIFDSIASNKERFAAFYCALIDPSKDKVEKIIERATNAATMETYDTDKEDFPMQVALVDHMIETSSNVFCSQEMAFSWL